MFFRDPPDAITAETSSDTTFSHSNHFDPLINHPATDTDSTSGPLTAYSRASGN